MSSFALAIVLLNLSFSLTCFKAPRVDGVEPAIRQLSAELLPFYEV